MNHILIVEDDDTLRDGLAAALTTDSITTQTAENLAEARQKLDENSYD